VKSAESCEHVSSPNRQVEHGTKLRNRSMSYSLNIAFLAGLIAIVGTGLGQSLKPGQHAERPAPPTRDPKTPGYVVAKELPDGSIPAANVDGNFIIGPTHVVAPEISASEVANGAVIEFTMNSSESKIYPGIAREPNTFGTVDPADPAKLVVTTSHSSPYTRKVAVYVPKQYLPGSVAPFIVGADGPDRFLFSALASLIVQQGSGNDWDFNRQRGRGCARQ